jgi:hypothetical protein
MKPSRLLALLLALSVLTDLLWYAYTRFIRDDAFITLRYAQNIANGLGFVYNASERIYGTSSPAMALLLAGWLKVFPDLPVAGMLALDIVASALSLLIVWRLLEELSVPVATRAFVLFVLIWSDKLLAHLLEGMEAPLALCCMLASLYFMVERRPVAAGLTAGFMLWLRIDAVFWIAVLALAGLLMWRRRAVVFASVTALTYLPWVVFAWLYFGTLIPETVIAKQVAYAVNAPPWTSRLDLLFRWLTPVTLFTSQGVARAAAAFTILVALLGAWTYRKHAWVRVLLSFLVVESVALVALNMTVEERYFIPTLYVLLLFFGLGLTVLWGMISEGVSLRRLGAAALVICYAVAVYLFAAPRVQHLREQQRYVNELSLQQAGRWLHANTTQDSVVYLEPLGYAGYYAGRLMLDDVGLITPRVVEMKRAGLQTYKMILALRPDYIILHCDDARRAPAYFGYQLRVRFDPLGFEQGQPWDDPSVQRSACYQIEERQ